MSLWSDEVERPVRHLRIIDLSVMISGPYLTRVLAQYGADVVKIEPTPNGDPLREVKNSQLFELLNQGKRSVAVDLKTQHGAKIIRDLAGEADVFIESSMEGTMEQFGLGYVEISEENPDLIYLSLRGLSGKNATRAARDQNFIASSGCGEWFLESGIANYSTQWADLVAGMCVPAIKLLLHLSNPARTGMHLVNYMDEAFRSLYLPRAFDTVAAEKVSVEQRTDFGFHKMVSGEAPHSRYYRCRDGHWVSLNAIDEANWNAFCEVMDRKEWKSRRLDTALCAELEKLFQDAPSSYWEALSANKDTCLFRVLPWSEHLMFSQSRPQLNSDPLTWAGFASNSDLKPVPKLGADTYAVLRGLGHSNKDIAELIQCGVLQGSAPPNSPD